MVLEEYLESNTGLLYHETQVGALCGVHAINTLLQGPYISEVELGQIAMGLDQLEREMMAEGGLDSEDYLRFVAQDSGNVAVDGMFSIQVLSKALEIWGLSCVSLDSPNMIAYNQNPVMAQAFMCNLREHWFTIRQVAGAFWDFNSLFPAPRPLTPTYLETFLATLREQGYSIFVILGTLPQGSSDQGSGNGAFYTPQQAREAAKNSQQARESGYLKAALNKLVPDGDDPAKQAMRRVTLQPSSAQAEPAQQSRPWAAPASQHDEDADLASAIAASLADDAPGTSAQHQAQPQQSGAGGQGALAQPSHSLEAQQQPEPSAPPLEPPEEPSPGAGVLQLALRLPQGKRLVRRFQGSSTVDAVLSFVAWHEQSPGSSKYLLLRPPRQVLAVEQTLEEAGVSNMDLLTVELQR